MAPQDTDLQAPACVPALVPGRASVLFSLEPIPHGSRTQGRVSVFPSALPSAQHPFSVSARLLVAGTLPSPH